MADSQTKLSTLMQPEVERLSKEYNVDMIELFVEYMDHVAKSSKAMSQVSENETIDISKF